VIIRDGEKPKGKTNHYTLNFSAEGGLLDELKIRKPTPRLLHNARVGANFLGACGQTQSTMMGKNKTS